MSIANWMWLNKHPFPPSTKVYATSLECNAVELRDGSGGLLEVRGTEFSSPWLNAKLPSISVSGTHHPISVSRTSIFHNENSIVIGSGSNAVIELGTEKVNQVGLTFPSADVVETPTDIENTFVEIYLNLKVVSLNNASVAVDISGVDSPFFETIGSMTSSKSGTYNKVFGIHLVSPDAFQGGNQYNFRVDNFGNQSITISKITTSIKSVVL